MMRYYFFIFIYIYLYLFLFIFIFFRLFSKIKILRYIIKKWEED